MTGESMVLDDIPIKKTEIVNAAGLPDYPMATPPSEFSELPAFSVDFEHSEEYLEGLVQDLGELHSNALFRSSMLSVDIWKEARKVLTDKEYQMFEMKYRFQYKGKDIANMCGLSAASVSRALTSAVTKLRALWN